MRGGLCASVPKTVVYRSISEIGRKMSINKAWNKSGANKRNPRTPKEYCCHENDKFTLQFCDLMLF